jgi:hypothetical protein
MSGIVFTRLRTMGSPMAVNPAAGGVPPRV